RHRPADRQVHGVFIQLIFSPQRTQKTRRTNSEKHGPQRTQCTRSVTSRRSRARPASNNKFDVCLAAHPEAGATKRPSRRKTEFRSLCPLCSLWLQMVAVLRVFSALYVRPDVSHGTGGSSSSIAT